MPCSCRWSSPSAAAAEQSSDVVPGPLRGRHVEFGRPHPGQGRRPPFRTLLGWGRLARARRPLGRPPTCEPAPEGQPFDVLHRVVRGRSDEPEVEDLHHVGVLAAGQGGHLPLEARAGRFRCRDLGGGHLERYLASQALLPGEVDLPHAAAAQPSLEHEVAEPPRFGCCALRRSALRGGLLGHNATQAVEHVGETRQQGATGERRAGGVVEKAGPRSLQGVEAQHTLTPLVFIEQEPGLQQRPRRTAVVGVDPDANAALGQRGRLDVHDARRDPHQVEHAHPVSRSGVGRHALDMAEPRVRRPEHGLGPRLHEPPEKDRARLGVERGRPDRSVPDDTIAVRREHPQHARAVVSRRPRGRPRPSSPKRRARSRSASPTSGVAGASMPWTQVPSPCRRVMATPRYARPSRRLTSQAKYAASWASFADFVLWLLRHSAATG